MHALELIITNQIVKSQLKNSKQSLKNTNLLRFLYKIRTDLKQ